ncbi:gamma-aminobutyric acid receptor, putative, partial [Ixodes scapularis]
TDVYIDIEVRSMGPVSEVDMTYSMDCYFRQSWLDRRLAFSGSMPSMTLSISMLEKIWRPDTSFLNGKHSYLHTITQPNKFVRLAQDGTVLYSSRLTVSASCPMNLEKFPMDTQRCPLRIGSSGYPAKDVMFRWNPKRRVVIASDMKLNQFDLVQTPTDNQSDFSRKEGPFAMLLVNFQLKRHMGYFLIEVYAPCTLLVVLSWVSFWINREATADRIALGVTTILTMTFLALESRNDLPKVPYCTALDYYVAIGFGFVFATIVEFAIVHYFTKVSLKEGRIIRISTTRRERSPVMTRLPRTQRTRKTTTPMTRTRIPGRATNPTTVDSRYLEGKGQIQELWINSVSKIDKVSRVVFPLTFIVTNVVYWLTYFKEDEIR